MPVSSRHQDLYEQWRVADVKARAAEDEVSSRLVNAIDRSVHPPGVDAWEESNQLRRHADTLLCELKAAIRVARAARRGA
jgi:hypothetical protein